MREAQLRAVTDDWQSPLPIARMRVYRNNVIGALTAALKVRYPVTAALVGDAFFTGMAAAYADKCRPMSPVLIEYGASFPDFIAGFEPSRSLPYLADTAKLESLWWQSYHAAEAEPLTAAVLSRLSPEAFSRSRAVLHPSVQIMQSPFAAASIWEAHHGGPALGAFDIGEGQQIVVARPKAEVMILSVSRGQLTFLSALLAGHGLSRSVEEALDSDPAFDVDAQIMGLFGLGLVTGIQS